MTSFQHQQTVSIRRARDGHVGRRRIKKAAKNAYKHVPHSEKAPHLVAKRNARERRRVETVNNAFLRLRRHVPFDTKSKRLSKVKTLRFAIEYIRRLTQLIDSHDRQYGAPCCNFGRTVAMATLPSQQERPTRQLRTREFSVDTSLACGSWYNPTS